MSRAGRIHVELFEHFRGKCEGHVLASAVERVGTETLVIDGSGRSRNANLFMVRSPARVIMEQSIVVGDGSLFVNGTMVKRIRSDVDSVAMYTMFCTLEHSRIFLHVTCEPNGPRLLCEGSKMPQPAFLTQ